jgi:hypothetical protein
LAVISPSVPADGAGTSMVTLSVSSSTNGSSTATASPAFLNQRPMVASVTDSPSVGTRISIMMSFPLCVMAGLVPAIDAFNQFSQSKMRMPGTSSAKRRFALPPGHDDFSKC